MEALVAKLSQKLPSMRPRGTAFIAESFCAFQNKVDVTKAFERLELATLSKLDEFIPHYLVKSLVSFAKAGAGSTKLYDLIIHKILSSDALKYSDMIRFHSVYPKLGFMYRPDMQ